MLDNSHTQTTKNREIDEFGALSFPSPGKKNSFSNSYGRMIPKVSPNDVVEKKKSYSQSINSRMERVGDQLFLPSGEGIETETDSEQKRKLKIRDGIGKICKIVQNYVLNLYSDEEKRYEVLKTFNKITKKTSKRQKRINKEIKEIEEKLKKINEFRKEKAIHTQKRIGKKEREKEKQEEIILISSLYLRRAYLFCIILEFKLMHKDLFECEKFIKRIKNKQIEEVYRSRYHLIKGKYSLFQTKTPENRKKGLRELNLAIKLNPKAEEAYRLKFFVEIGLIKHRNWEDNFTNEVRLLNNIIANYKSHKFAVFELKMKVVNNLKYAAKDLEICRLKLEEIESTVKVSFLTDEHYYFELAKEYVEIDAMIAITFYCYSLLINPLNCELLTLFASFFTDQNQIENAFQCLNLCKLINPKYEMYYYVLAKIKFNQKQVSDAFKMLDIGLSMSRGDSIAYDRILYRKADYLRIIKDYSASIECYNNQINPHEFLSPYFKGLCYFKIRNYKEGIISFSNFLKLRKTIFQKSKIKWFISALILQGICYHKLSKITNEIDAKYLVLAHSAYSDSINEIRKYFAKKSARGNTKKGKKKEKGIFIFDIPPNNPNPVIRLEHIINLFFNRGCINYENMKYQSCLLDFKQVIELWPTEINILENLKEKIAEIIAYTNEELQKNHKFKDQYYYYYLKGSANACLGKNTVALEDFEKSSKIWTEELVPLQKKNDSLTKLDNNEFISEIANMSQRINFMFGRTKGFCFVFHKDEVFKFYVPKWLLYDSELLLENSKINGMTFDDISILSDLNEEDSKSQNAMKFFFDFLIGKSDFVPKRFIFEYFFIFHKLKMKVRQLKVLRCLKSIKSLKNIFFYLLKSLNTYEGSYFENENKEDREEDVFDIEYDNTGEEEEKKNEETETRKKNKPIKMQSFKSVFTCECLSIIQDRFDEIKNDYKLCLLLEKVNLLVKVQFKLFSSTELKIKEIYGPNNSLTDVPNEKDLINSTISAFYQTRRFPDLKLMSKNGSLLKGIIKCHTDILIYKTNFFYFYFKSLENRKNKKMKEDNEHDFSDIQIVHLDKDPFNTIKLNQFTGQELEVLIKFIYLDTIESNDFDILFKLLQHSITYKELKMKFLVVKKIRILSKSILDTNFDMDLNKQQMIEQTKLNNREFKKFLFKYAKYLKNEEIKSFFFYFWRSVSSFSLYDMNKIINTKF